MQFVNNWIIKLAQKNPFLALLGVLLVGLSVAGGVIKFQNKEQMSDFKKQIDNLHGEISKKEAQIERMNQRSEQKDSIYKEQLFFIQQKANDEVQAFLIKINQEQASQIRRANENEQLRVGIIKQNKTIINKSHSIIKNIDHVTN